MLGFDSRGLSNSNEGRKGNLAKMESGKKNDVNGSQIRPPPPTGACDVGQFIEEVKGLITMA
jgi:hypothetical protein